MKTYIEFDALGNITAASTDAREGWLEVPEGVAAHPDTAYVKDGQVLPIGPDMAALRGIRPSRDHRWDFNTLQWVDPRGLEELKLAKWAAVKQAREAAEYGTFTWDGSSFDGNPASLARLQLAGTGGMVNPNQVVPWTLADNTVRNLSAADLVGVLAAYGTHVATVHATGRALRSAIEAAATKEDLEGISWPA